MDKVRVSVDLVPVDTAHGHWCPVCAVRSARMVTLAVADHRTLLILDRTAVLVCDECGPLTILPPVG